MGRGGRISPGDRVRRGRPRSVAMAEVHLPATLVPLFPELPRRIDVDAGTVDEVIDQLDERWPGVRDRLCEPGPALRPHINVYVDKERAELETARRPRRAPDDPARRRTSAAARARTDHPVRHPRAGPDRVRTCSSRTRGRRPWPSCVFRSCGRGVR